ncbi:MAG TPA: hypothetical protein PLN52_25260 [Opitutaceae bacterium]|nr:hypothetical protein [Opitutaceae bacterium]
MISSSFLRRAERWFLVVGLLMIVARSTSSGAVDVIDIGSLSTTTSSPI